MATSSVVIAGATYPDVPSVTLKDTSNTDVSFILTSDADATASDIRKNKIAYANGQKIVGDYELNLQEKTVNSSTSAQVITADSGYLVNQDPLSGSPYGGNYQIQYNDVPHSATLVDGEKYRFQVTATTNGATFTYDEVLAYTWGTNIHSLSLKTNTPVGTLSILIFTYRQYADGETDCTLKTLDSSVDITDSVVSLKVSYVYDGLSQVTINPYTLGTKTVTPTTSTQVITPEGETTTYINEQNQQCQYVMTSSRRQYINLTWIEDLVVGETYHFYIVFDRRSYGGTQYYFVYDGDKEFTGFPMSFSLTSTTSTRTDVLNLSATELYRNGVSDDDGTNYMTLVVTKQGESYDGLSQVTVNPIPSDYVHVEGTIPITANGTVDVSAYQYAEVNVSGGSQTQSKTATPTKSTQTITPDSGYLLSSVVVNPIPSEYIIPNLQTRTGVTPTKSSQTITPSSGYDGLASVQINAIPSNYIDTTDATASASDIRSGKSAYVNGSKVNGSLVVNKVYVGSTDPSSSFGNDGDIYIKVV